MRSFEDHIEIMKSFMGIGNPPDNGYEQDLWNMGPKLLRIMIDLKFISPVNNSTNIDDIRTELMKEYGYFQVRQEIWKVLRPPLDPIGFWIHMITSNTFTYLARLALFLLDVNVVNSSVERSFKASKKILPDDRNRLGWGKFQRELKIKLNSFNMDKRQKRLSRIEEVNSKF